MNKMNLAVRNRKKHITILSIAFAFLVFLSYSSFDLFAQKENKRFVYFDKIQVNGKNQQLKNLNDLILSNKDTIFMKFFLEASGFPKEPISFKIGLYIDGDSAVISQGINEKRYAGLAEGSYIFKISAFNQLRTWETEETIINFKVDNKMNQLIKQNEKTKEELRLKDSLLKNQTNSKGNINNKNLIYIIVIIILIFTAILLFLYFRNGKNKKVKKSENQDDIIHKTENAILNMLTNGNSSKSEVQKLVEENTSLKNELAALRGQIDNMSNRTKELRERNKELEESVNKLSNTKDELENLSRQKDDLFAVIIHDIKNPAALIKSLVELLRSYDLTAGEQQEVMNDILATTSKIVSLSHEVSRILALEGGRMRLDIEGADMGEIAKDVFHRNQIKSKEKNINMILEVPENLPDVEVDAQKINEVIDNLLSNALKFTPNKGTVKVKVSKVDQTVVLEVSDNGPGLTEEDLKEAFKRGSQLSAKPTGNESSTGLGLWIVKKLVEAHNGRVWVRSTIGKGATFAFSVPLHQPVKNPVVDMSKH